jgi:hypothetical protein
MKYISVDYLLKHQQRYEKNDYGDCYLISCVPVEIIINADKENIVEIENKTEKLLP